ncbi:MAG: porin [Alphaproteobacteria bacterium]|nr:porin [Alphaproteobacteria bacterium]
MKIRYITASILCFINTASAQGWETDYALSLSSYYGYTHYSTPKPTPYKTNNLNATLNAYAKLSYNFNYDYIASIIGYAMIDSAKEIENYNQGNWGEEFFTHIETPFGELSLGQDYNVAYNFAVGAPNIGSYRTNNSDITNFITNPNWYYKKGNSSFKTLNSTYINTDGASAKINYITPEFFNTKLGITYIPKTYSRSGLVSRDAQYKDKEAYVLGAYNSFYIKDYEIETSLGYADFTNNDKEYSLGFSVYRKGWTLGASYRKTKAENSNYQINKDTYFDAYRSGQAYNLGLSYAIGPITTGVSYFNSKSDEFDIENDIISFSNSYEYNKNTTFSFTIAHLNSKDKITTKGYAFVLGMELSL